MSTRKRTRRSARPTARTRLPRSQTEFTVVSTLAERINALRQARGWTQRQLAEAAGISRGYLSHILAGDYSPTIQTLTRIAVALGVEVKTLFE